MLKCKAGKFGVARADASLPYTLMMVGFGLGGILMGRLSDRFGVMVPVLIGGTCLGLGFIGPRLPIVMGVFYIFIGPIVAIAKEVNLAAAMTALIIGGAVQFAWSPLIGKLHRFFPPGAGWSSELQEAMIAAASPAGGTWDSA